MRLALYQPDIPQNTGTLIRLAACLGLGIDLIEPCGFVLDDRRLRRAGLDYHDLVAIKRHRSWDAFRDNHATRLILLTTQAPLRYSDFAFKADDCLLLGQESCGAPQAVHAAADARVRVPMMAGARSLNIAVCAAMVVGEALRQTAGFPASDSATITPTKE